MALKIILADDHAVVRDGLRLLLEAEGDFQVVGMASDGRQALALSQSLLPDVVIMDIAMPTLNGIEATQQVRSSCPHTHVVVLSMYATSEYVFRALQAGASAYVLKESAGSEVVQAVRAAAAGRRFLSKKIDTVEVDNYLRARTVKSPLEHLSGREREVLQLTVEGQSCAAIAKSLGLSPKTVETYRSRIMTKLGVEDVTGLVKFAVTHGITTIG